MKTLLFTFVSEKILVSMADTFWNCIQLPIQIINEQGQVLVSKGSTYDYCRFFKKHLPSYDTCQKQHSSAAQKAISFGEPYIFACHAQLNHIVYPLMGKQIFLGAILVGPFLMDKPDSTLISELTRKYSIPTNDALELYDEANGIPVVTPTSVNHISHLLFYLFSNLIADSSKELSINNQKLIQQSRINESIQRYKEENLPVSTYPFESENELLLKVKLGDVTGANTILNDLLGYVLLSQGGNFDIVKARAIELSSLLSRTAIEGGASADSILKLNTHFLKSLQSIDRMDTLCMKLQEIVETFSESMFNYIPSRNSELIRQAMIYISERFNTPLTLNEAAAHVHLNPSYFSGLFKSCAGCSFKEYLNMVRIEESKRLLTNTDFSIIDIAVSVGFEDQSYFSKVFKKYTGLTPKQFR